MEETARGSPTPGRPCWGEGERKRGRGGERKTENSETKKQHMQPDILTTTTRTAFRKYLFRGGLALDTHRGGGSLSRQPTNQNKRGEEDLVKRGGAWRARSENTIPSSPPGCH